jgi:hypothetical protein
MLLLQLEVLHGGQGINKIAILDLSIKTFFCCKILQFLVRNWIRIHTETNEDPQHCG